MPVPIHPKFDPRRSRLHVRTYIPVTAEAIRLSKLCHGHTHLWRPPAYEGGPPYEITQIYGEDWLVENPHCAIEHLRVPYVEVNSPEEDVS